MVKSEKKMSEETEKTWFGSVGNGDGEVANMIGNDAIRHVDSVMIVGADAPFVPANAG
jgi:hypothetical protein